MFVFFVYCKSGLSKVAHPLKLYQNTKFRGPTLTGANFCIHLKSLNIHHFGMVAALTLKTMSSVSSSMA
jgi:hypothetical protein